MLPAESTVPVLFLPGTLCDARVFAAISARFPPNARFMPI
jgi:hypothetical protein